MRRINLHENQLSLPFGEGGVRSLSYEHREKLFWYIVGVSVISLFAYIYAINAAAHHIAVRQNLEKEVALMKAELGSLQFTSIALKNGITIEKAYELGFTEVRRPLYVSRDASAGSLTFNTAR